MGNDEIAKILAGLIGTTAFAIGTIGLPTSGSYSLPSYSTNAVYNFDISKIKLTNPYEVSISLQSEDSLEPIDPPIPIAVTKRMVFSFTKPQQKSFTI
jgi:hypothetical protein